MAAAPHVMTRGKYFICSMLIANICLPVLGGVLEILDFLSWRQFVFLCLPLVCSVDFQLWKRVLIYFVLVAVCQQILIRPASNQYQNGKLVKQAPNS